MQATFSECHAESLETMSQLSRCGNAGRYDPDHIRKGLLCMLDTDMNAEVVEAVAEAERAGAADDD